MDMSDDDVVLARTSTPTLPFPPRFHHAVPFYPVPAFHQHYYPHAAYLTYHPGYGRSILSNSPYALMKTNASHPTLTHFHSHTIPPQQLPPGVPSVSTTEGKEPVICAVSVMLTHHRKASKDFGAMAGNASIKIKL